MTLSRTSSIEKLVIVCPLCNSDRYEEAYRQWDEALQTSYTNVVCRDCGFLFRNPTLSPDEYAALYGDKRNLMSGSEYVHRAPDSRARKLRDERLAFFRQHTPLSGGSVLDIGGGDGFLLEGFDGHDWKRVAVDPGERTRSVSSDIEFFRSGIEQVTYTQSFDVVLCVSVLEHLRSPRAVVHKIYGLLGATGMLMLEVPNSLMPAIKISEFYSFEHLNGFTPATLNYLLESEGFSIIATDDHNSISNLRVLVKKSETKAPIVPHASEHDCVMETLHAYAAQKEKLRAHIRQMLAPVDAPEYAGRVAVYGAGSHTLELLDVVDFRDSISCFVDSDTEKQGTTFLGKPVLAPEALGDSGARLIILSSGDYQAEMYERIRKFEQEKGIQVIKLYPEGTL